MENVTSTDEQRGMRGFLIKVIVALLVVAVLHVIAAHRADGTTDAAYLRFTVKDQRSLVLGGSRAAQGIWPEAFNDARFAGRFDGPLFNFSFTLAHSPYGPTYLRAVEQVLDTSARNGLFILQVDPWQLSDTKDSLLERDRSLGAMHTFGWDPNYEYLLRYYDRGWGALTHWPWGLPDTSSFVLENGRLKVNAEMAPHKIAERTARRLDLYRNTFLPGRTLSPTRLASLSALIDLLREHGTVVLVRLPASPEIEALEQQLAPDFNTQLFSLAAAHGARYLDRAWSVPSPGFTDGIHLDERSGRALSDALAAELLAR